MKNLVIIFLISVTLSPMAFANNTRKVTCEISLDTDYAPIALFNGFKRKNYDRFETVVVNVPITSDPQMQTLIYESPELNSFFMNKTIRFTANVSIDPNTNREKLFIGMYEVVSSKGLKSYTDRLDSLMYFSKMYQIKNYDGKLIDREQLYLPIGSSVTDSGFTEIYNGNYGNSFDNRLKMSCALPSNQVVVSPFNPESRPRERFTCNINAKHLNSRNEIDEINKRVTLGFMYSGKRDLQPIIEDDHFEGALNGARIMANLYIDPQTKKPMFLLGIYQAFGARSYSEVKHAEYKPSNQMETGVAYYMPVVESVSESDYIEVRTLKGFATISSIKAECKKISNPTVWLDKLVTN